MIIRQEIEGNICMHLCIINGKGRRAAVRTGEVRGVIGETGIVICR